MHPILQYIHNLLPPNAKTRNTGWEYFNCPCCYHTESPDTKHRGNILFGDDYFIYQCFNCKFKTGFSLGHYLSKNAIQLLKDMGITSKQLSELMDMIKEYNEGDKHDLDNKPKIIKREIRPIPNNYKLISESLLKGDKSETLKKVCQYINNRNPRLLSWGNIYWAEKQDNFLIPDYENGQVVGYTLRMLDDESTHKYMHFIPQGFIYNQDNFNKQRKYEILVEGQLDALSINCVSILSNLITPDRLKKILTYTGDKEIIIMPDRDKAGKKLVEQILTQDLPFSVSFPNWELGIKDVFDAVKKYGRLYTIYSIINSKEDDKTKIKMKSMKWFQN